MFGPLAEEPEPIEEPTKSCIGGAYVLPHLRSGGTRLPNIQVQPDLESTEEFPTLDAAAQEKPKKESSDKPEVVDNSWTEVNKSSQGHKIEDTCAPHAARSGFSDGLQKRSTNSYSQRLEERYESLSTDAPKAQRSGWSRGDAIKTRPSAPVVESYKAGGWARGTTISAPAQPITSSSK